MLFFLTVVFGVIALGCFIRLFSSVDGYFAPGVHIVITLISIVLAFLCGWGNESIISNSEYIDKVMTQKVDNIKFIVNMPENNILDNDYIFASFDAPYKYSCITVEDEPYYIFSNNVTIERQKNATPMLIEYTLYKRYDMSFFERILALKPRESIVNKEYLIIIPD